MARAKGSADRQVRLFESIHATRFVIEALALRALCREASGERDVARADLERALELALPGGYVRLFVDLGPRLAELLDHLDLEPEAARYAVRIRAAFQPAARAPSVEPEAGSAEAGAIAPATGAEPLTGRELDILDGLARRLANKEIAAELGVSSGTVKSYAHSVYKKLAVSGRRRAVARAIELGLLPDR